MYTVRIFKKKLDMNQFFHSMTWRNVAPSGISGILVKGYFLPFYQQLLCGKRYTKIMFSFCFFVYIYFPSMSSIPISPSATNLCCLLLTQMRFAAFIAPISWAVTLTGNYWFHRLDESIILFLQVCAVYTEWKSESLICSTSPTESLLHWSHLSLATVFHCDPATEARRTQLCMCSWRSCSH